MLEHSQNIIKNPYFLLSQSNNYNNSDIYDNRLYQYLYIGEIVFFQKYIILKYRLGEYCVNFFLVIRGGRDWLIDRFFNRGSITSLETEIVTSCLKNKPIIDVTLSLRKK